MRNLQKKLKTQSAGKMRSMTGWFNAATTALAIVISLAIAFVIIFIVSDDPGQAIRSLVVGPLSSVRNFGTVIETMITITFTGLAVCVMFQAGQMNMAAEGAFFLGAMAAAAVSTMLNLPSVLSILFSLLAGAFTGAVLCLVPAALRAKFGASEMVSSLMLNYVSLYLGLFFLNYFLRDASFGMLASPAVDSSKKLTQFIPKTRVHTGIFIAVLLVFVVYILIYKTKTGYNIRCVGNNASFANYSGLKVGSAIVASQVIGGAIAGLGGGVELLGMYDRFQWTTLPGYGWDGIIIAILARNKPQFIPLSAFFLSYLRIGSSIMARTTDVPAELITVIQAIMIMLVTATALLGKLRHRFVIKEAMANGDS